MTKAKVDDLSGLDQVVEELEKGIPYRVINPKTGKPLSMVVMVCGPDSERFKAANRWLTQRGISRASGNAENGDTEDDVREYCARLCVGWSDFVIDGKTLPFSVDNAVKLFKRFPFIQGQIDNFAGNKRNFTSG